MTNADQRTRYDTVWRDTQRTVAENGFAWDERINSPEDTRYGITLRLRPDTDVRRRISALLGEFVALEPDHHYYTESEMHVTVLSLLTCRTGFALDQIDTRGYVTLLEQCLASQTAFTLRFVGVTASTSCVMVQGFDESGALARVRDRVRAAFKASALEHTIDQRYTAALAHSTVLRFSQPVGDPSKLVALIERHRDTDLGDSRIVELELVGNDWYHSHDKVHMLAKFGLQ